jgi:recombination protein RecA
MDIQSIGIVGAGQMGKVSRREGQLSNGGFVMHDDPRTTPGGVGKDYAYFVRCEVKRDEWLEAGTGQNKKRVGQSVRIRTLKNKSAPPQRTAYVDYYFDDGGDIPPGSYDTAKEIVSM